MDGTPSSLSLWILPPLERLLSAVRNFALGAPQYDDLTALVLRYKVTEQISALDGLSG